MFLPLYGYGRVYDLRMIALEENSRGLRTQGYVRFLFFYCVRWTSIVQSTNLASQMDFNSGFEWSYWLNSLIAARAAWVGGDAYPDEYDKHSKELKVQL